MQKSRRPSPRVPLPTRRPSQTAKAKINGTPVYLTVGYYDDLRPAEVWLRAGRASTGQSELLQTVCITLSIALQNSVPLDALLRPMEWGEFDPYGAVTDDPKIRLARSPLDWARQRMLEDHPEGKAKPALMGRLMGRFHGHAQGQKLPVPNPLLEEPPNRAESRTHKVRIGGVPLFLMTSYSRDGRPLSIGMRMGKTTTGVDEMYQTVAQTMSVALQYGVPLHDIMDQMDHGEFSPCGRVDGDHEIRSAVSPLGYVGDRMLRDHPHGFHPELRAIWEATQGPPPANPTDDPEGE